MVERSDNTSQEGERHRGGRSHEEQARRTSQSAGSVPMPRVLACARSIAACAVAATDVSACAEFTSGIGSPSVSSELAIGWQASVMSAQYEFCVCSAWLGRGWGTWHRGRWWRDGAGLPSQGLSRGGLSSLRMETDAECKCKSVSVVQSLTEEKTPGFLQETERPHARRLLCEGACLSKLPLHVNAPLC